MQLDTAVSDTLVATAQVGGMLLTLEGLERPLVVTTSDRIDTILACTATHMSGSFPIAGIMIAAHDFAPTPYRGALQRIFDNLERQASQSHSYTYRLPVFMTQLPVVDAVHVRVGPGWMGGWRHAQA